MNTTVAAMALLMGFTGSLHCAGMCGPIVWIMPFQSFTGTKKALAIFLYHAGRISIYSLLAIVLYSFRGFFDPKIQQYISIITGALLLLAGLVAFFPNNLLRVKLPWTESVKKMLGRVIGRPGLAAITLAGILNGLLPCGLVYMALSAAISLPTVTQAIGFIYLFGIGTMPMLVSITVLRYKVNFLRGVHLRKLVPVAVLSFGCLIMLRGMNLGIPYLSPKVSATVHGAKSSCCQKK